MLGFRVLKDMLGFRVLKDMLGCGTQQLLRKPILSWLKLQGDRSWAGRASPEQLALVRADLDSLAAWTEDQFWPEMQQRLSFLPTQVVRFCHLPNNSLFP